MHKDGGELKQDHWPSVDSDKKRCTARSQSLLTLVSVHLFLFYVFSKIKLNAK